MAAFIPQWQSPVFGAETTWATNPKIFTICLFTEQICGPLPFIQITWEILTLPRHGPHTLIYLLQGAVKKLPGNAYGLWVTMG